MKYLITILMIIALLVVACNPTPTETTEEEAMEETDTMEETEEETMEEKPAEDDSMMDDSMEEKAMEETDSEEAMEDDSMMEEETSGDKSALIALFGKEVNYMIKYEMTSDVGGTETTSSMTQYMKGTDKMRTDVETQGVEVRTYIISETLTSCNNAQGSWLCIEPPTGTMDSTEDTADTVKEDIDSPDYTVTKVDSRTVAGASADCYEITVEGGTVEYCYTDDYVPVYVETSTSAGTIVMEATEYSTDVSDADFELPA